MQLNGSSVNGAPVNGAAYAMRELLFAYSLSPAAVESRLAIVQRTRERFVSAGVIYAAQRGRKIVALPRGRRISAARKKVRGVSADKKIRRIVACQ